MPKSQGLQWITASWHNYQYGSETNIYPSSFSLGLALYHLETSKLSYRWFNYKLDLSSSILSKITNYTKISI